MPPPGQSSHRDDQGKKGFATSVTISRGARLSPSEPSRQPIGHVPDFLTTASTRRRVSARTARTAVDDAQRSSETRLSGCNFLNGDAVVCSSDVLALVWLHGSLVTPA